MNDEKEKLSAQLVRWSIALTMAFAALISVISLLVSVYGSAQIIILPWFARKLVAEISLGAIMQLASVLFGVLFISWKSTVRVRVKGEPLVFIFQAALFFVGLGAFLLFSIELFRSVTIP